MEILQKKNHLHDIDPVVLDLPQDTKKFVNDSFCPYYRDIRNKCKELRVEHLIHQYFMISSTVRVKVQENSSPKAITHMIDLEQVLPEVEIERFKVFSLHKK